MYAIIKLAGHQHRVKKDQIILSEATGNAEGSEFDCGDVMLVGEGSGAKIGKPFVSGASVRFKVLSNLRGEKLRGYKYKKRKGYHKAWGHRQSLQKLQVVDIKN
ncbi:MAG: 50S ribosomal protein L21 [Spirochaetia bacterium]|nr:50S ribosomal protein L21 [Spirochaetia bacterium]